MTRIRVKGDLREPFVAGDARTSRHGTNRLVGGSGLRRLGHELPRCSRALPTVVLARSRQGADGRVVAVDMRVAGSRYQGTVPVHRQGPWLSTSAGIPDALCDWVSPRALGGDRALLVDD